MTLLTVVQHVAEEQALTTIADATSDSPDAATLRRLVNVECNALARRFDWSALQKEHTFATVASQASYDLPTDYLRIIQDTAWNRSDYWRVRGATSPQEWQLRKSGLVTSSIRDRFRIKGTGTTFFIDPTPDEVQTLVFEYISKNWAVDGETEAAKSEATKNSDTFLFDEYLIERGVTWRFLSRLGMPYAEERSEYDRILNMIYASDGGGKPTLDMAGPSRYRPVGILPDGGYGS